MRTVTLSAVLLCVLGLLGCGGGGGGTGGGQAPVVSPTATRPLPDASRRICVFNDQLPDYMTAAQTAFAATHYVGCQKVTRALARRLRATTPNFLVLHYRLGIGLGYKWNGDWIQIINGDNWVREWPAAGTLQESWFFHYKGQRVELTSDGWYLMDVANAGYRRWWSSQVLTQLANNEDDGLFADACSVPSYLGSWSFTPQLPDHDPAFEAAWTTKIDNWLTYLKRRLGSRYLLIPNAGYFNLDRDKTNYALADGVMVEGFAAPGNGDVFYPADWQRQMNRIMALDRLGKVVIAQSYLSGPSNVRWRGFYLSCYLLIKARHTYLNMALGLDPAWFPEYGLDLGAPSAGLPASITAMRTASGAYVRAYTKGLAVVNPTGTTITYAPPVGVAWRLVTPVGGGDVPANANISAWHLNTAPAPATLTLGPRSGAVLLR